MMDISIDSPKEKFNEHLQIPSNSRVLFTGPFGTGKSHFLREYFKEEKNLFWLSPVNYVVGANQDIFEWIKIDIARELISKHIIPKDNNKFSKSLIFQTYVYQNAAALFGNLIFTLGERIEKLKGITGVVANFKEHYILFKEFEKQAKNEEKSFKNKLTEFLENSFQSNGSIYEDDLTTRTIRASIEYIKQTSQKETVLVIDDIDRLDPEHIFRILNILSSHNDHFDSNKFGFGKVILVCDLRNIEHVYKHRYGGNCDFEGYIEKFFTYEPFHFSIKDAIVQYCQDSFKIANIDTPNQTLFTLLLVSLYESGHLKIRNLKKIAFTENLTSQLSFGIRTYPCFFKGQVNQSIINTNSVQIDYGRFAFLKVVYLLSIAFGGLNKLKLALLEIQKKNEAFDSIYLVDVAKAIAILSHLSRASLHTNSEAFFTQHDSAAGRIFDLLPPKFVFLGKELQMPLQWRFKNQYTEGDYFRGMQLNVFEELSYSREKGELSRFYLVISEIVSIINLIKREGLFTNLD